MTTICRRKTKVIYVLFINCLIIQAPTSSTCFSTQIALAASSLTAHLAKSWSFCNPSTWWRYVQVYKSNRSFGTLEPRLDGHESLKFTIITILFWLSSCVVFETLCTTLRFQKILNILILARSYLEKIGTHNAYMRLRCW